MCSVKPLISQDQHRRIVILTPPTQKYMLVPGRMYIGQKNSGGVSKRTTEPPYPKMALFWLILDKCLVIELNTGETSQCIQHNLKQLFHGKTGKTVEADDKALKELQKLGYIGQDAIELSASRTAFPNPCLYANHLFGTKSQKQYHKPKTQVCPSLRLTT